ncbi:hypothetical protein [Streptomyces sp. NPDC004267]|uniref:hypothetical protein n=1 Tax=Streptomyces sp. NPDC004267 TaxID=3364694 RepID=UPI0036C7D91F
MSTTTTGADPEPTPRRARFARPFRRRTGAGADGARGAQAAPAGVRRVPLVTQNRNEERVRATARERGRAVAREGVLDPWVLVSGDRVPYLSELASVRDHLNARMDQEALEEETRARAEDAHAAAVAEDASNEVRRIDRELGENERWLQTNRRQLDRLAAEAVRGERFRDGVRRRVEARWLRARFGDVALDEGTDGPGRGADRAAGEADADGSAGPGAGGEADGGKQAEAATAAGTARPGEDEEWQSLDADPAAAGAAGPGARRDPAEAGPEDPYADPFTGLDAGVREETDAARWEGLPHRPGLPRWMVWALLLVIAAVEVPIYWIAFQPFHGAGSTESDALSGTLAISAAIVMVVVPHLAGRALRARPATGAARWANLPAIALLGAWGFSTWALGYLRSKLVFRHRDAQTLPTDLGDVAGLDLRPPPTLVDSLHLEFTTVTWMFVTLLVLSGGIGLLLGLLREHPYLDSYRSHLERGARLRRDREAAVAALERARAVQQSAADRTRLRAETNRARQRATTDLYESAANAFLMGVAEGSRDPAVTEAAMRLSSSWPLLPFRNAAPERAGGGGRNE